MLVRSIAISNFKSFNKLDLDHLGRFNILIGSNASGKTNFIQVFRFLRDIAYHGLSNAVSLQGGADYLKNTKLPMGEPCAIRVTFDLDQILTRKKEGRTYTITYRDATYDFSFNFLGSDALKITRDCLIKRFDVTESALPDAPLKKGTGESFLGSHNGELHYELRLSSDIPLLPGDIFPAFLQDEKLEQDELLMEHPAFGMMGRTDKFFDKISIYDFDPRLPKHSVPITGKAELEDDAGNLAICLKKILDHRDQKRKFFNLVKEVLPFIEDIGVEKIQKALFFRLKDKYSGDAYVPSSFISDGTLNLIALIIALYFEKGPFIIMEEPERSIHPQLLAKMVAMMKEVSDKKQILLTTHHPDIVRMADITDILYSSRDREGFSTISRPAEKKETRILIEKDLGIDDLFKHDLLDL